MGKYEFFSGHLGDVSLDRETKLDRREKRREKERREKGKKYYHISYQKLRIGDIVVGRMSPHEGLAPDSSGLAVFLTTKPEPHYTIAGNERRDGRKFGDAFVYRVVPQGKIRRGKIWDELTCGRAEVVEILGPARQFLNSKNHTGGISKVRFRKPMQMDKPKEPKELLDLRRKIAEDDSRKALYRKLGIGTGIGTEESFLKK
jgi:hypothetical protein